MMQMQATVSHNAQTERNSRFKAICRNIETTEHEIHVHSRKLDRLKKKLMVEEKKNAINLLKSMRIESERGTEIPFSKPRKRGLTSKFMYEEGLKSEDLADEYLIPLHLRYPETGYDFEIRDVEDIKDFAKDSKYYEQMHELIHSPRNTIPSLIDEKRRKREEEERRRREEQEAHVKQERKQKLKSKLKASSKLIMLSSLSFKKSSASKLSAAQSDDVESVEIEEDVFEKTRKELFGIKNKIDPPPQENVEKKKPEKNNLLQLLGIPTSDSSSNLSIAGSQSNLSPLPTQQGSTSSRRSHVSFSTLVDAKRSASALSSRKH